MPSQTGQCKDCGRSTSKRSALRCRNCNFRSRRGKGNWPPKKTVIKKKCPLCGNINHLNFNQQKIWDLKEQVRRMKDLRDALTKNLGVRWRELQRWDKKIERAQAFYYQVNKQANKRMIELKSMSEALSKKF
jgi:hypothetical protein